MALSIPPETKQTIATYLSLFRDLVRVDRSWHDAVLHEIIIVRYKFSRHVFDVAWLEESWGSPLFNSLETRLVHLYQRLLGNWVVNVQQNPISYWWFFLELHLHRFCQKSCDSGAPATPAAIFDLCFRKCMYPEYSCRELFPERFENLTWSMPGWGPVPLDIPIPPRSLQENGFVRARGMPIASRVGYRLRSPTLGQTLKEVFGTLECMRTRGDGTMDWTYDDEDISRMFGCGLD